MEWFSRKTSIAGTQISNWILVLASGSRPNLGYILIRRTLTPLTYSKGAGAEGPRTGVAGLLVRDTHRLVAPIAHFNPD